MLLLLRSESSHHSSKHLNMISNDDDGSDSCHFRSHCRLANLLQVWPVLCIAGGRKAAGSAPSVSLSATSRPGGAAPKPAAVAEQATSGAASTVDVKLRTSTLWFGLPIVRRLHSFLEPLVLRLAAKAMIR